MLHPLTRPILAALSVAGCLATPAHARAEPAPQRLPVPVMWTEAPEAVKAAASALRSACAAWTQGVPRPDIPNPPDVQRARPAEGTVCEAAINPEEVRLAQETSYIVLAAAVVGLALASFVAAGFALRFVAMWVGWGAEAAWDTWPSFRRRYR